MPNTTNESFRRCRRGACPGAAHACVFCPDYARTLRAQPGIGPGRRRQALVVSSPRQGLAPIRGAGFQEVPDDSVVFVKTQEAMDRQKHLYRKAHFYCLSDTWRARAGGGLNVVPRGDLLAYLNPVLRDVPKEKTARERRVVDREDLLPFLPFPPPSF